MGHRTVTATPLRAEPHFHDPQLHDPRTGGGAVLRRTTARLAALVAVGVVLAACQQAGQSTDGPRTDGASGGVFAGAEGDDMAGLDTSLWKSGREAEQKNQFGQAVGAYLNLYNRHPDNPRVVAALARNLRYDGRADNAVQFLEDNAAGVLDDPQVRFEYAKAQLADGRKAAALKTLDGLSEPLADDWRYHSARGIAHDALGEYSRAIDAYRRALALSPDNPVVLNNLAMSQAMSGRLQDAVTTLEKAAGLNRSNPHIRQNLALLYAVSGDEEQARALAAMDLSASDLENNLTFYRRFGNDVQ